MQRLDGDPNSPGEGPSPPEVDFKMGSTASVTAIAITDETIADHNDGVTPPGRGEVIRLISAPLGDRGQALSPRFGVCFGDLPPG